MAFCINCGKDTTDRICSSCGDKVIGFDESMSILIKHEKNHIDLNETKNVIKLWNSVTKHASNLENTQERKFNSILDKNALQNKIAQILQEAQGEIQILGTESILKKQFNSNILKILEDSKVEIRVLSNSKNEKNNTFTEISACKFKKIEDTNSENFCFIIKDNTDAVFFINNSGSKDKLAIYTNSKSFIITLKSLFNVIWNKSDNSDSELKFEVETSFEERLKELEQKKIILSYLQDVFKLTETELANRE